MYPPASPHLSYPRTKSLFAALLTCAGAGMLASSPAAHAGQTSVVSLVSNFTGVVQDGDEGLNLPQVTPPFKASDGNYYGIAPRGGSFGNGFIYKIVAGKYSVLYNFHNDDVAEPPIEDGDEPIVLIQAKDGNLYGICFDGGTEDEDVYHDGGGTIFTYNLSTNKYAKLYDFDKAGSNPDTVPAAPVAFLQSSDGNFYGLTNSGGKSDGAAGTFFRFDASTKVFTELHDFTTTTTVGVEPKAQLLNGGDGYFYGTTSTGGGNDPSEEGEGAIFKITTAGHVLPIHFFLQDPDDPDVEPPQPDSTPLILGNDGYIYGATTSGGSEDYGTIYRISSGGGTFTLLHNFTGENDGGNPFGGLVMAADGNLYGGLQYGFGETPDFEQLGGYFQYALPGRATSIIHKFASGNEKNPFEAASALTEISPGTFYGQTQGGSAGIGTLVKAVVSPAVVSATTVQAVVNKAFTYHIVATGGPTSYAATGLPAGLGLNTTTGTISGTPTRTGTSTVTVRATNAAGTGSATLKLTVQATLAVPSITSAASATTRVGQPFSYQIVATGNPTQYGVGGIIPGLTLNPQTGLLTGRLTATGTHSLVLRAANAAGTGQKTLTLTVTD